MRKHILISAIFAILIFAQTACAEPHERALDYFVQAFRGAGFEFATETETPHFQMIGAIDGVLFPIGGQKVVLYEFTDVEYLGIVTEIFDFIQEDGWMWNGRFLLETNITEARKFFTTLEIPEHINAMVTQLDYEPLTVEQLHHMAEIFEQFFEDMRQLGF